MSSAYRMYVVVQYVLAALLNWKFLSAKLSHFSDFFWYNNVSVGVEGRRGGKGILRGGCLLCETLFLHRVFSVHLCLSANLNTEASLICNFGGFLKQLSEGDQLFPKVG
jgi:hypothetical protein